MNDVRSAHLSPHRRGPFRWLVLPATLTAIFITGCVTQEQVQNIVNESNSQMLVAAAEGATQLVGNPKEANAASDRAIAQIDAFVAQHPNKPALTSPLRLRQAILYLNKKAFAGAEAAFEAIDPSGLHTSRDQAIYKVRRLLIWWYEHAQDETGAFLRDLGEMARQQMGAFATAAENTKEPPELKDYFLEARAWIGLKLAGGLEQTARSLAIKDALDVYATVLSDKEIKLLTDGKFSKDTPAFSRSTRVVLRTHTLLEEAAKLAKDVPANQRVKLASTGLQNVLDAKIGLTP